MAFSSVRGDEALADVVFDQLAGALRWVAVAAAAGRVEHDLVAFVHHHAGELRIGNRAEDLREAAELGVAFALDEDPAARALRSTEDAARLRPGAVEERV